MVKKRKPWDNWERKIIRCPQCGGPVYHHIEGYDKCSNCPWREEQKLPTRLVGAKNVPEEVRAAADYLCDGVDDQVEIQAALDSLPLDGGRVFLSGWFKIDGTIKVTKGKVLEGVDRGAKLTFRGKRE